MANVVEMYKAPPQKKTDAELRAEFEKSTGFCELTFERYPNGRYRISEMELLFRGYRLASLPDAKVWDSEEYDS